MGQTLTHGVYLPDEGERNCYNGLAANWSILDGAVGTIAEHTTALSGKAPLVHTHTKSDITDFPAYGATAGTICEGNDSRLSDARTPVAHTHVTADVTDFPDMTLYPYKLAYTDNGGNFPYINLADSGHIALGFNGITDTGIYKVRATADVPGTPNALTMDGILIVFNSDGTANVSSHRRCQQIFYQNSTTPKIFKRIGVFNITSQTWNWDTYKWVEYANTGRDFIPNETNSLNIGSSTNQWNNLYAKNYFYNGTAWGLDKYNQWTGVNEFNNLIGLNGAELWFKNKYIDDFTTNPAEYGGQSVLQIWNKNTTQYSGGLIDYQMTDGSHILEITCFGYPLNDPTPYQHRFRFAAYRDGVADFYPALNSVNLGTSTNKWKSLNGINPGALSLPDIYDSYNVVTTNWSTSYSNPNNLQINGANPSYPGWLFIRLDNCTEATDFIIVRYYHFNAANITFYGTFLPADSSYVLTVPIQAGITTKVWVSKIPTTCKYYACLGAVK